MTSDRPQAYLVVNADDYGYFRCVSRGILEAASRGIVTATGIIANRDDLVLQVDELRAFAALDVGVHLNLTAGAPLTPALREKCARWGGGFPGKYRMVRALLSGAVRAEDVADEWCAQIERCLSARLELRFLNSHEHIHMLPPLFGIANTLASRYGIPHVRFTAVERPAGLSAGALLRGAIVGGLQLLCGLRTHPPAPHFLGLNASGRLDETCFRQMLPTLRAGQVYELMCHPGRLDAAEVNDPRLLAYHEWEGELAMLTSPQVRDMLLDAGVSLVRYRDLHIDGQLLVVRPSSTVALH